MYLNHQTFLTSAVFLTSCCLLIGSMLVASAKRGKNLPENTGEGNRYQIVLTTREREDATYKKGWSKSRCLTDRSSSESTVLQRDGTGDNLDIMVLIPCQGCRDGYDCYNQDQCSEFYAASYYSNGSVFYDQIQQVNQSIDFSAYVSQHEFTNYHQPQPFYFQSHPYTTPYYQALYHRPGYQGQSQYNNHDNNIISDNLLHQDYMPSLDIVSSLNVTEKSTENIRRAISYVRRSRNATLFSIEGKHLI